MSDYEIELTKEAYHQIEQIHEARVYYAGFRRLITSLMNRKVEGKNNIDLDVLNKISDDLMDAHHRLIEVMDAPYELYTLDDD